MPSTLSGVNQLVEEDIIAYKDGNKTHASELIAQVLKQDPNNKKALLWLSGIVKTDGERLFCLKRILAIEPQNEIARQGLTLIPSGTTPIQPSLPRDGEENTESCTFPGCNEPVSKAGFKFCYKHWKAVNAPLEPIGTLTATALGEKLNLTSRRINLIMAEIGWVSKERKGWIPTPQGKELGATQKEHHQTGIPFVLWPESILSNKAFLDTVQSFNGELDIQSNENTPREKSFREKFPAKYRTADGHWVRSKAEGLIDNWLYMFGVIHAYERQVPIEEEMYCDFYLPKGKVYIESWGLENNAKYLAHKKDKIALYQKYKLNLIEMSEEQLKNLDDFMPKALLKFNIEIS
jgi:hypothetical protein